MALQMRSWLFVVLVTVTARPAYSAGNTSDKWELHDFPHPFNLAADYLRKGGLEVLPDAQNIYAPGYSSTDLKSMHSVNVTSKSVGAKELLGCFTDSYGRGAGVPLQTCAPGLDQSGLLCYAPCLSGYGGAGPMCWGYCPDGFRDDGAYCAKPEAYGRGAGYAWQIQDGFSNQGMWDRCEAVQGKGNCEQCLAIVYPKCNSGYHAFGCNICSPDCPSGWEDIGVSCHKPNYGRGWGLPMICEENYELDGALCYEYCSGGYKGIGPVCWATFCPPKYPEKCGAFCVTEGTCGDVSAAIGTDASLILAGFLSAACALATFATWGAAAPCWAAIITLLGGTINAEEYLRRNFDYCYNV